MNLYIQLKDGVLVNHPILESNLRAALPDVNLSEPNCGFIPFERIAQPKPKTYEVIEGTTYVIENGVAKDRWEIRAMTNEEIALKQEATQNEWEKTGFKSWVFDSDTCSYTPPIPYPEDGGNYRWNEQNLGWERL